MAWGEDTPAPGISNAEARRPSARPSSPTQGSTVARSPIAGLHGPVGSARRQELTPHSRFPRSATRPKP
jgi:hypothetical protein